MSYALHEKVPLINCVIFLPENETNQSSPSKVFTATDLLCAPRSLTFFCVLCFVFHTTAAWNFFCDSESIKVPCPATDIKTALFFVAYLLAFKVKKNNSPFSFFSVFSAPEWLTRSTSKHFKIKPQLKIQPPKLLMCGRCGKDQPAQDRASGRGCPRGGQRTPS